ncbi:MAG: 3-hydroxyanthranilate 3,4-dioxygenase [Bdellovibrio sp. CG12_big_fil_rev_8_21_14_0_65_39_13]|nr:MAG: 3-hydroxyanthranilate 3,4-dioxygenase [Bdellovibrio sp. CG22_combo_CG10-13_8_21_14_all_39_27]PIQ61694.1 MAG: 3-hydroxyanthranilate 3,4-dioxygenase [Bdellovibrio sp. CG12_big_fil_rev_8_21_14_0_65_39_13]PIR35637.1 MAG: 3-hydroxyanthranilate 3,4-dioxygenase [Bdellovibrio sp. CG11_big_fil_rev_8_21_14_0_20_39_38]
MSSLQPLNFKKWIDDHRDLLKPPVGNKMVWKDRDFIVMVVGGPNARTDFHVNQGEEFFYQLEGNIFLRVVNSDGEIEEVHIKEGDIFLLPPNVPHSPQREAGSIGLVIERKRKSDELDGLQWYCFNCHKKLYEEYFHLTNIETQFGAVFDRFYSSEHTTCRHCKHVNGKTWS